MLMLASRGSLAGVVLLAGSVINARALGQTATASPGPHHAYHPMFVDLDTSGSFTELGGVNPFLDRRMQVVFVSPSGRLFNVPGFFAGDGSEGSDGSGSVFRARFTPDEAGSWSYAVSFREGPGIAIDLDPESGVPGPGDDLLGSFEVLPPNPDAPGFFAKGRLEWVGEHYLRFQDGDAFVKGGADSPENWLGYVGFDNTEDDGNRGVPGTGLHTFAPHVGDWNPGDPDWDRTDPPMANAGRGIVGALNYLHAVGINAIYFLPMNIGGDAWDTWPYAGPIDGSGSDTNDNTRFDVSKLNQWDIVFNHAQSKGIMLHVVLNEAERPNKEELDGGELGVERKLFYREMVARFGYHNAITWNLCEEYNLGFNLGAERIRDFASYLDAVDPYDHPTTVHQSGNPFDPTSGPWAPFVGGDDFDLTSLQRARQADGWGPVVAAYRDASEAAGRPIAVMIDEPASPTRDVASFDDYRKRVVWDILISGGGHEVFINDRDQSLEDFREFEQIWTDLTIARDFIESLPFDRMLPQNDRVTGEVQTFGGAEAFVLPGETYAAYFPNAWSPGVLDVTDAFGEGVLRWYNPRTGELHPEERIVMGGGYALLEQPPLEPGEDWAFVLEFAPCTADTNRDGVLTGADFNEWFALFMMGHDRADTNGDGVLTGADFNAFLSAFARGCG